MIIKMYRRWRLWRVRIALKKSRERVSNIFKKDAEDLASLEDLQ